MKVEFAGTTYGDIERLSVNRVLDSKWLASGQENELFEKEFSEYLGVKHSVCVNSGSSANLLALAVLDLPKGSRVLTSACGFPATLSPIIHLGLEPVLVDYDIETHNIDIDEVVEFLPTVKAVMFAHTMGIPADVIKLAKECEVHGVCLIEDCCEALGATLFGKQLGTFGDISTFSFYPAHQITAGGEGGMICTNDNTIANKLKSLRSWGKHWDWQQQLGDDKTVFTSIVDGIAYYPGYTYETLGYNMKLGEMNAAFGREQLKKLDLFVNRRDDNYNYLRERISKDIFMNVRIVDGASPSYFGYTLTLKQEGLRDSLLEFLEKHEIRTRPFFAGNITRHKPFIHLKQAFCVADYLMKNSLFIGVWQGLTKTHLDYVIEIIDRWIELNWDGGLIDG